MWQWVMDCTFCMYSTLSDWRRGAKAWERKLIKQRNLSLEAHCAMSMHKSHTHTHNWTCAHTHIHSGRTLSPVVCLHHVRVLACSLPPGDKKCSVLCVDNYSSHPYLAPEGLLRCRQAKPHTQAHIHTHSWQIFSLVQRHIFGKLTKTYFP